VAANAEYTYKKERAACIALGLDASILDKNEFDIYQLGEIRKGLEENVDVSSYLDPSIPWFQMEERRLELTSKVDMSVYRDAGFDWTQLEEIRLGLADGLDVSVYAKADYLAAQMKEIRLGLKADVPVFIYADPGFDWFQMEEIRLGLQNKVDISLYAKKEMPFRKMRQIREALEQGIDVTPFINFNADIIQQLVRAYQSQVNIVPYIREGYGADALEEIRIGLEQGVDMREYLNPDFRGDSVREIRLGMEKRLPVELYANIEFNFKQMQEIRLGLEHRIDVQMYAKPLYMWEQMHEIRLGMEEGLNVERYSSLMYSATDMKRMRQQMEQENLGEGVTYEELEKQVEISSHMTIVLSHDRMQAFMTLDKECTNTAEEIIHVLELQGIKYGIDKPTIERMVANRIYNKQMPIAYGRSSEPGPDGYYEFLVGGDFSRTPKELADGSVDYQNVKYFEEVQAGQTLAIYHEAEFGKEGSDVLGNPLTAKKGKEQPMLSGKGLQLLEDKKTYVAAYQGKVEVNENDIEVSRLYVIEDATLATGNVKFPGSILVRGYVGSGVVLEAEEDVVVEGSVEGATIKAQGNIMIKSGMMGNEKGSLEAKGDVSGKFFESVTIRAGGSVSANYVMQCDIVADGRVEIFGNKGVIIGGCTQCVQGIDAYHIGNTAERKTLIRIGLTDAILQEFYEIQKNISKIQGELKIFYEGREKFQNKYSLEKLRTMDIFIKIFQAIEMKEHELEEEKEKGQVVLQKMDENKDSKVVAHGDIYPGTIIEIDKQVWLCKDKTRNVTLKKKGEKIVLFAN
jgi:uncharacterized protein (DUF342 family)